MILSPFHVSSDTSPARQGDVPQSVFGIFTIPYLIIPCFFRSHKSILHLFARILCSIIVHFLPDTGITDC